MLQFSPIFIFFLGSYRVHSCCRSHYYITGLKPIELCNKFWVFMFNYILLNYCEGGCICKWWVACIWSCKQVTGNAVSAHMRYGLHARTNKLSHSCNFCTCVVCFYASLAYCITFGLSVQCSFRKHDSSCSLPYLNNVALLCWCKMLLLQPSCLKGVRLGTLLLQTELPSLLQVGKGRISLELLSHLRVIVYSACNIQIQ